MLRRLPISLRFDDEDSDFYFGFIEQKKNDRELSSLILDLLHVYYENEEVRNIVNDYVIQKSPYMHIHEQLERIALEHSRQTVSTNILNDFTDNARKKVSEPPEPVKEEKPAVTEEPLMLNAAMDKLGPMIEQKVSELFAQMLVNQMVSNSSMASVANVIDQGIKQQVSNAIISNAIEPNIEVKTESPIIDKPVIEKPIIAEKPIISSKPAVEDKPVPSVEDKQNRPTKPASFGKLLGSVR